MRLFNSSPGTTAALAATQASARIPLPDPAAETVRLFVVGAGNVFIEFGNSSVAATIPAGAAKGSVPIAGNRETGFSLNVGKHSHIAAICPTGETATVYVTCGTGS